MNLQQTIPMTSELLDLIIMVQDFRKFKVSEAIFKKSHGLEVKNYDKEVELFYNSIGDTILNKYDLSTNKISLRHVLNFKITNEMLTTEAHLLPEKFDF